MQTTAGPQHYQLHQYVVSGGGGGAAQQIEGSQVEGGEEFGYLQLSSGYLKIEGYCNAADELATTIPALQAYEFKEAN
jgi:hypothetical protein